jgi:hypothetical protein
MTTPRRRQFAIPDDCAPGRLPDRLRDVARESAAYRPNP